MRQAINHAIDRQTLVDKVRRLRHAGQHDHPAALRRPAPRAEPRPFTYDPVKAGQLLDEAGYPLGADGKRVGPDGTPLTLRLLGRQESQSSQQTVQFVQGWLEEIGITVDTKIVTEDTLIELNGEGRFDMFEWGWVVEPDPDYQLSTFTCAQRSSKEDGTIYAGLSDSHFCNEEYDRALRRSRPWRPTRPSAPRSSRRCSRSSTTRRRTPSRSTTTCCRPTDPTGSPTSSSSRRAPGPLLFQFGTWSYQSITPVGADDGAGGAGSVDRHRRRARP